MILPANVVGVIYAILSAGVWGAGDFTGGVASRRSNPFHTLALSALSGLVILAGAALIWREAFPSPQGILWAMLAGATGAVGIAALYRGLATGRAASVAPTSGVIGAALPVLYAIFTQGLPSPAQLAGFGLACAGIWLVSAPPAGGEPRSRQELWLACVAGTGFGLFFIFLGMVETGKIFTPLVIARIFSFCTGVLLVRINHLPFPGLRSNPTAWLAGLLDAGGNLFYILARQYTRLDVAAVLSSLYPASTVILSGLILKEHISRRNWLGLGLCLAAIGLITV
ncbi:MAG: DMT family transporter [Chloroflexi bacterium]|nr:DMT family transporter [Chloroflexota bacterium]